MSSDAINKHLSEIESEHAALVASEKCLRRICSLSKLNAPPQVIINEINLGEQSLANLAAVRGEKEL